MTSFRRRDAGAYEKLVGTVEFALDPSLPASQGEPFVDWHLAEVPERVPGGWPPGRGVITGCWLCYPLHEVLRR